MILKTSTLQILFYCLAAALSTFVAVGFSGVFVAIGDSAAVVRLPASTLLFIVGLFLWLFRARFAGVLSVILAAYAIGTVVPMASYREETCTKACVTLYQKNLLSRAWPRYTLADDIVSSGAEVVTLQEVSDHNRKFMARMFEHFPTMLACHFRPSQQVAILTSLPAIEDSKYCLPGAGLAAIQVEAPSGALIWVVSIHLPWPYPYDQYQHSQTIANWLSKLEHPVLVAGDFNMVPWGASVQRIVNAAGNRRLGSFQNTYRSGNFVLPLPIDAVLVPSDAFGSIKLRPYLGSDHLGILAQIEIR